MRRSYILYSALVVSACGTGPKELYVDERFTASELADIRSAAAEVNKLACLVGEESLVDLIGGFRDGNGRFEQQNVDNDKNELFRCGVAADCENFTRNFDEQYGNIDNLYGFRIGMDIGILTFNLAKPDRPPLKHVVMHELGHLVGMKHVTGNSWAVMAPHGYGPSSFTQADKEEFCLRHGCDPDK